MQFKQKLTWSSYLQQDLLAFAQMCSCQKTKKTARSVDIAFGLTYDSNALDETKSQQFS